MIAVHVGAGYHSDCKLGVYKQACTDACLPAMNLLHEGGSAQDAVALAISKLEDAACTNAGLGSNLTEKGAVECDACLMTGDRRFGACGAVSKIKNPIQLAARILTQQNETLPLGRVAPCVVVGDGAHDWAVKNNIALYDPNCLKTAASCLSYNDTMERLKSCEDRSHSSQNGGMSESDRCPVDGTTWQGVTDTVGAVCMDNDGRVAAGASSGGILLKHPGRLGPAAMFGCGCWAEDLDGGGGVAIAASGCGEQLMQTMLVRECARKIVNEAAHMPLCSCVQASFSEFMTSLPTLWGRTDRNAGLLVLHHEKEIESGGRGVELVWTHSTPTMCLGYHTSSQRKPVTVISRNNGTAGKTNVLHGKRF